MLIQWGNYTLGKLQKSTLLMWTTSGEHCNSASELVAFFVVVHENVASGVHMIGHVSRKDSMKEYSMITLSRCLNSTPHVRRHWIILLLTLIYTEYAGEEFGETLGFLGIPAKIYWSLLEVKSKKCLKLHFNSAFHSKLIIIFFIFRTQIKIFGNTSVYNAFLKC